MNWSELYWHRITPLHFLLWPASLLYILFQTIRRFLYRQGALTSVDLGLPVIVVDSITINNAEKIPALIWVVDLLKTCGLHPAIIGRGYPDNYHQPMAVTTVDDVRLTGGESLLLANLLRLACPVWIGHDRVEVAKALLQAHPECNILICNDGLQDLCLHRDVEIVVVNTNHINFGNGLIIPAGPLRDRLARLKNANAVVIAGSRQQAPDVGRQAKVFQLELQEQKYINLVQPTLSVSVSELNGRCIHAMASGINAQHFVDNLKFLKAALTVQTFSGEHRFVREDFQLDEAQMILMPWEDAVKCLSINDTRIWYPWQQSLIEPGLREIILQKLREKFMDPKLLDILVCPLCKGPLIYKKDAQELICKPDRLAYPIRDGIPVMLEDEARAIPPEENIK